MTTLAVGATTAGFDGLVRLRSGHRLALITAYILYFGVVVALAATRPSPGIELVLAALFGYIAVRVAPLVLAPPAGWFHPFAFLAVVDFLYLARRAAVYAFGLPYHQALAGVGPEQLNLLLAYELFLMSLGVMAYYVGLLVLPSPRPVQLRVGEPRHLRKKVIAVVGAAALVCGAYLSLQDGLSAHILSWRESRHVALAGEFYWINAVACAPAACLVWFALDPRALAQRWFWAAAVMSLGMAFVTHGSRSIVLIYVFLAAMVWMMRERRMVVVRAAALLLISVPLLGVLGNFRNSTWGGEIEWEALTAASPAESLSVGSQELVERATTADGTLPILARVPDQVPFLLGSSYLAALLTPMPRALWRDKPPMVGGQVGQVFFRRPGGVPPGAVGEAYWNFHVAGVVMAFLLFGVWHRWLLRFLRANEGPAGVLLYAVALLMLPAPTSPALVATLLLAGPIVLVLFFTGALRLRRARHG